MLWQNGRLNDQVKESIAKMIDRDKVIKGLEVCRDQDNPPGYRFTSCVDDCPYYGNGCARKLKEDALDMMKEQEAIKPITEHKLFLCPVCKNTLFREQKFCHECGKRIEWEGR
jgi:hypothetical protein